MMDHVVIAISRDPPHNQLPNADTIAYTSKILLKGPRYSWTSRTGEVMSAEEITDGSSTYIRRKGMR